MTVNGSGFCVEKHHGLFGARPRCTANLQRAPGKNIVDRTGLKFGSAIPRHDAVSPTGVPRRRRFKSNGVSPKLMSIWESTDPAAARLAHCASGSQDGFLAMGGSRYLRSKRLQMQPESLSSRSKVDGEHDTHPNNYQDQAI